MGTMNGLRRNRRCYEILTLVSKNKRWENLDQLIIKKEDFSPFEAS